MKHPHCRVKSSVCVLLAAVVAIAGCAAQRPKLTEEQMVVRRSDLTVSTKAELAGAFDRLCDRLKAEHDALVAGSTKEPATVDILVLSGGGDYGAFGAGFIKGWDSVPPGPMAKPEFDVVTGVSTGALIAPFAFMGDDESESRVLDLYRNPRKDWVRQRGLLFFLPANVSFAEVPGLERDLRAAVNLDYIKRIAEEGRKGRLLAVNTSNIDDGSSQPFDLTAEAERASRTGDVERFERILLASAGIPGAFPPREIDGCMYVDGGVTSNIIFGGGVKREEGFGAVWRQRYPDVPVPRLRYWVIFNNQLVSPPSTVQPTWPSVIGRSVEMAIRYSTITSLRHMFTLAELRNMQGQVIEVRVVAIPPEWRAPKPGVFVKETMDDLADIGEKLGRDPASWMTELP